MQAYPGLYPVAPPQSAGPEPLMTSALAPPQVLTHAGFDALLAELKRSGHRLLGPIVRDDVVVYDDIESSADLPRGWTDVQDGGHYRLQRRGDDALFGYAVSAQSWKPFLHPPEQRLWSARMRGDAVQIQPEPPPSERMAFVGARACELHAIALMDRALLGTGPGDPYYRARRAQVFIIAVNCSVAGGTCFCDSMHAGPQVTAGFDLALTELSDQSPPVFLVHSGTTAGSAVLAAVPSAPANAAQIAAEQTILAHTRASMGRKISSTNLHDLLLGNLQHPSWTEVGERCLACGNCTMVCPTCMCTSVADVSDLSGERISRSRRWDSCYTSEFSYLHGGSVRHSTAARYRQWLTHKLATWHDQYGSSGCVGCGRCITWCPVGIDLTEQVRAIAAPPAG